MSDTLIRLTDNVGKPTSVDPADMEEPFPGSIVMTNGEFGTVWQRYFSDGLWHRVGGGAAKDWVWMTAKRNLVLVYDAPFRA